MAVIIGSEIVPFVRGRLKAASASVEGATTIDLKRTHHLLKEDENWSSIECVAFLLFDISFNSSKRVLQAAIISLFFCKFSRISIYHKNRVYKLDNIMAN
jgi:hypothetical protein